VGGGASAPPHISSLARVTRVMRLYDYDASGNCFKVRLLLALLGREYERVPVDIFAGDTLTDEFARVNPLRETPVLETDDGELVAQSNAILFYLEEEKFARARECYDKAISPRTTHNDPIYRRGVAAIHLNDFAPAATDLEYVISRERKYDSYRAIALLAHAYANTGRMAEADNLFNEATEMSTASETYLNYATFLAAQNRNDEARQWARRILAKKPTMPRYLQRRERPWFRKASALLKLLGAVG